jgi:hypothetical protein
MSTYNHQHSDEWFTLTSGNTGTIYILRLNPAEDLWEVGNPSFQGLDIIARTWTVEGATLAALDADKVTQHNAANAA